MNNPVLQSEHFESAAHRLCNSIATFPGIEFTAAIERFERAVDKLARIYAMQAENDQRKAIGASMAYDESSFLNA
jgi:hypothetical protein